VDPATSKASVLSTKVELILRKKLAGQKWAALEGTESPKSSTDRTDPSAKQAVMATLQQQPITKPETAPSYPTSSKSGPKNWDKLASDLTAKRKKTKEGKKDKENEDGDGPHPGSEEEDDGLDYDDDEFGGDPVDGFFKKLYKSADDDTKRAMMKSFQESNGTALSTNWSEVGQGRVEPVKSKDDD
jgi:hypothetical protein